MSKNLNLLTRAAVVAALYVVLTLVSNMLGLANGAIQVRLSEALTLLPVLFAESVWGLFAGCLISNIITGCVIWDIICGSLATLIGAFATLKLKKYRFFASVAPVVSNTVIVPFVLKYAYGVGNAWWFMLITVAAGEIITCMFLAPLVIKALEKHKF